MNEIITKLNLSRLIIALILQIFLILFSFSIIYFLIRNISLGNIISFPSIFVILLSIFIVFINIFSFRKTSNSLTYISLSKKGINIFQPLKFKSLFFSWADIKGYSKSDYFYGGKLLLNSKSIIIYTKNNLTFEIIKIYIKNFTDFQTNLSKSKIAYFGTEPYITGNFGKRTWKYKD